MLKQFLCWFKTRHENRIYFGFKVKPVDIAEHALFKKYTCKDCGYKGEKFVRMDYDY